jgi:hypothetical protein
MTPEQSLADEIRTRMYPETRKLVPYAGKDHTEDRLDDIDERILRFWRYGDDTMQIARRLTRSESFVANRLAAIRDARVSE